MFYCSPLVTSLINNKYCSQKIFQIIQINRLAIPFSVPFIYAPFGFRNTEEKEAQDLWAVSHQNGSHVTSAQFFQYLCYLRDCEKVLQLHLEK